MCLCPGCALGQETIGKEVVVLGGGLIGAETAAYCTELGVKVAIVEQLSAIALEEDVTRRQFLLKLLEDKKLILWPKPVLERSKNVRWFWRKKARFLNTQLIP